MQMVEDIRQMPELDEDLIHIWGVHIPGMQDRISGLYSMLNDDEQEKAGRFYREADRHASIVSRGALRVLLAGYGGMKAEKIRFRYSQNGKPYVPDSGITFNVSHSGEWIVLGIGRNRRIGVDIEAVRRETDVLAIATRYFLPEEVALISDAEDSCAVFFRLWARKEAYVKACGSALFRELSAFQVSLEEGERDGWFFHDLEAGSRHAAAVVTDRPVLQLPCYDFGGLRWEN